MARKDFMKSESEIQTNVNVPERLTFLVKDYIINKDKEKEFKDIASAENTEIKELMNTAKLSKFDTDDGGVTLSERVTEDFIEEKLIEFLKTHNCDSDIVKTKEYVDFDALESALYHEKIPADVVKEMASCKEKKITQVLRIKKKGE